MLRKIAYALVGSSFVLATIFIVIFRYNHRMEMLQINYDARIQRTDTARKTELASFSMLPVADTPAESARCLGLLHACQSWLALKDGVSNDIVITSPGSTLFFLVHIPQRVRQFYNSRWKNCTCQPYWNSASKGWRSYSRSYLVGHARIVPIWFL